MTAIKFAKADIERQFAESTSWPPYPIPPENLEGDAQARGRFLLENGGSHGNFLDFGMATCEPSTIRTSISNDIVCFIVKGELTIEADGKTIDLEAGDVIHYTKGTEVTMRFHTPFQEFFVHAA